jgi:hypothetical protein
MGETSSLQDVRLPYEDALHLLVILDDVIQALDTGVYHEQFSRLMLCKQVIGIQVSRAMLETLDEKLL